MPYTGYIIHTEERHVGNDHDTHINGGFRINPTFKIHQLCDLCEYC